jgi:hypothetical protein
MSEIQIAIAIGIAIDPDPDPDSDSDSDSDGDGDHCNRIPPCNGWHRPPLLLRNTGNELPVPPA